MIFWVNPRQQVLFSIRGTVHFYRNKYRHTNVASKRTQREQKIIIKIISHSEFFRVLITRQIISPEHQWKR